MTETTFPAYSDGPSVRAFDTGAGLIPSVTLFSGEGSEADRGGSITTGGSAQQLAPVNLTRRGFSFQNQSASDLRISFLNAATLDYHSLLVIAGAYFETTILFCGTGAISVIGATTGQTFYARDF